MADNDPATEAAEPPEGDRLDKLEATQETQGHALERIEQALSRIVPGSHAEAQQRTEQRLDRGSSLAEQVKAELAKAKEDEAREAADAQAKDAEKSEREEIRAAAAALREKPPAPPRNPLKTLATKGWGDA